MFRYIDHMQLRAYLCIHAHTVKCIQYILWHEWQTYGTIYCYLLHFALQSFPSEILYYLLVYTISM